MAVNYDGFAQGFQGGFGLMQGAINDQRQTELEQSRLDETKRQNNLSYDLKQRQLGIEQQLADVRKLLGAAQAGNLNADTAEIPDNAASVRKLQGAQGANLEAKTEEIPADSQSQRELRKSQSAQIDAETEEIPADSQSQRDLRKSQSANLDADTNVTKETGVADVNSQINLRSSQAGNLDANAASTNQNTAIAGRLDRQLQGAEAMTLMMGTAQDVIDGNATPEQFSQLLELNQGTITEAGLVFNPSFDMSLESFKSDLANGNYEGSSGVDLLNAVAKSSNQFNIGAMVDETFVNAPEEMRSGGYKVVSSEFIDFREVEGGITGTVLNVVEDTEGNQFMYTSPNTAGRNTSDGAPLVLAIDDLMAGLGAVTKMRNDMGGMKAQMKEAAQIAKYGAGPEGQSNFMAEVQDEVNRYDAIATADGTRPSPIPNMTMQQFVDNPTVMNDFIEVEILFDYESQTFGKDNYMMLMEATRQTKEAREIQNALGSSVPLTPKELQEIQVIRRDSRPKAEAMRLQRQVLERIANRRRENGIDTDSTSRRGSPVPVTPKGGIVPAPYSYGN